MELLAPAGDLITAKTAIDCGADACYVGGEFGARAYAKNLSYKDLHEIIRYAHARGSRVHVALNTMIFDSEIKDAMQYGEFLYSEGVDAVIIADVGLADAFSHAFPGLPLHASTQMGICDKGGALFARALGCSRVVPAREVSISGLRSIAETGIEVEAFVHGALCSGISGTCLLSQVIGERSGNRGRCAQPCRMLYSLGNAEEAYHLSAADLCMIENLADLRDAGVCSLKIEGRMKRREYVALTVYYYKKALAALDGGSFDTERAVFELKKIFNRGGFTKGYYYGGRDVTYTSRQNHMGVYVGKVAKIKNGRAQIKTRSEISKGDGVEFFSDVSHGGLTLPYADVISGGYSIAAPPKARAGDEVYLTSDKSQLDFAAKIAEQKNPNQPLSLKLKLHEGKTPRLEGRSADLKAESEGEAPLERARNCINTEKLEAWLSKTGGTIFGTPHIELDIKGEPFINAAQVNALRRETLTKLESRFYDSKRQYVCRPGRLSEIKEVHKERYLAVQVRDTAQALAAAQAGADRVYFLPREWKQSEFDMMNGMKAWLCLPPFWDAETREKLNKMNLDSFDGAVVGNVGQIEMAKELFPAFVTDSCLNVGNSRTAAYFASLGAESVCVSTETDEDISGAQTERIAGGRIPVINLRHCPVKKSGKCPNCESLSLADKFGAHFKLVRTEGCLLQALSHKDASAKLYAGDGVRLAISFESARETERKVKDWQNTI